MNAHEILLEELLGGLEPGEIRSVLDAGSGRTSLSILSRAFPKLTVDCVVYPGDTRKIESIRGAFPEAPRRYRILETDLCRERPAGPYDLAAAHLLLGEAAKFGGSFSALLAGLFAVGAQDLVIIDYLEDPDVDYDEILRAAAACHYETKARGILQNQCPQQFKSFSGIHNFGLLLRRRRQAGT